ncbi:MAG TPA: winged helix-turn-helix transcriptional regulator [Rhizobiales bacterium]|nr:winged helix-turn-helix transcriptional regulator [Hyphomicrobiales bacterium]
MLTSTLSTPAVEPARAPDAARMLRNAQRTGEFLKSLSHPIRLVILCRLSEGGANVGELEELLDIPQAAVSKQLARLRDDGLVTARREGRSVVYSLADSRTQRIVGALYDEFCN